MKLFGARAQGQLVENMALQFLQQQGLKLVDRNYASRRGEIDLIMQDVETLVFIEVRFRKSDQFGSAAESVNSPKQQRIIQTAQHYLQKHTIHSICRFDVVAVMPSGNHYQFDWVKNAFEC